jgi:FkbM family methyltransferase
MLVIKRIKSHAKTIERDILNEPLNKGNRFKLIANYFQWHFFQKKKKSWVLTFENGYKSIVKPVPDNDAGAIGIWTKNVDYHETNFTRQVIQMGDYIVDAGCNVGNRTLVLADLLGGALLIDANKYAIARVSEHLNLNKIDSTQFVMLQKAVGDREGVIKFTNLGGASTLNKVIDKIDSGIETVDVEMTTIDKEVSVWGKKPTYIKIDVEGEDLNALKGAINTLMGGSVKLVKFERNQTEALSPILEFFKELNWTVFAMDNHGKPTRSLFDIERARNLFAMPDGNI